MTFKKLTIQGGRQVDKFQQQVDQVLLRHRSFLDITSKTQESSARVNRALMKAITECGCIEVHAKQQSFDETLFCKKKFNRLDSHLLHELCESCREIVQTEIGKTLFYLAALCNLLNLSLDDIIEHEMNHLSTLGYFNLQ